MTAGSGRGRNWSVSNLALRRRGSRGRVTRVDGRSVQGFDLCIKCVKKGFMDPLVSGDIARVVGLSFARTMRSQVQ